jgi:hypothetical protein
VFLIMFKTGHALLLPGGRFLSPRSGRGLDAECPRNSPAHPLHDHGRVQSVTVSWPCPQPRPQSVPVRVPVRAEAVRDQSTSANYPCPRPVRSRAQSMTVSSPCSWTVRDRVESVKCPGHGCIASALRTIHLHILSAYVRI